MATPQLLRKLKTAAHASKPFINACKRALEGILAQPDVSFTQSQGDSLLQDESQVAEDNAKDIELKEEELRAWREATEPLQSVLPENTIYFIPYSLINNNNNIEPASATTLLAQINAINLALTLEMFLPQSTRVKFPMLTTHIPFIDASSTLDGAALVASSQADERSYPKSGFGMSLSQSQSQSQSESQSMMRSGFSQSHPDLTQEQKIDFLTLPLAELKSVYLRLCAGRKEKHVLYVLRRVILEICCISIITSTKARVLKTFKPQDLLDTFKVTFLKDPSLVGSEVDGGVFASKEVQDKACKLWEKWAGDVMHRFQSPLSVQHAYTWEALADTLLTDLMRHVLPPVLEILEVKGKKKITFPTSTVTLPTRVVTAADTTTTNNVDNHPRAPVPAPPNDTQTTAGNLIKPPAKSTVPPAPFISPAQPKGTADLRFFAANKKMTMKPAAAGVSKFAATIPDPAIKAGSSVIPKATSSTASTAAPIPNSIPILASTPNEPTRASVDVDEFGPRLVNPAHKGRVVLPNTERTVIHAPGTAVHEFDMMDYVQDYEAGFGNDDGGVEVNNQHEDEQDEQEEGTPFAVAVARFGQEPYIPAPKFGFTRVPENFRFNAPQRNAVKVVMTPSPESEKGSSYAVPKGSTLSRIKAAVVHSKGRGDPDEEDADDSPGDDAEGAKKGRKRKQSDEEEYVEEAHVKKRKGGNGKAMAPPARMPIKSSGAISRPSVASSTTTLVNPLPYAARHSSASSSTLFNPSDMAGPSSTAVRAGPIAPRHNVVMADTDSSDDGVPFRRRKAITSSKTATTSKAAPAPAAKSTSTTAKKASASTTAAVKKASTSTAAPAEPKPKKPVPLPVSDELMKSAKDRLSQIKEINEKNKRLYAALIGEDEEDPDATEDSEDDNEEELRKFRARREREARGELRGPPIGDLEKSRDKLEDLKKRSKEVEKLPMRRRAKKEGGSSEDSGEEEEEEERVDVPRPRGRPRKNPKQEKREREPRVYKYAVGGNERGRVRWTDQENKILLFALEATFYEGDLLRPWQKIREQYGPDGSLGQELAAKNVMQIKDRARSIAEKMVREGQQRPDYLAWIKVSEKKLGIPKK